jgi:rhomboid protease GluP
VAELTPHVYLTPVLIAVNVLVFILMAASGVSVVEPTVPELLRWGGDFAPQTASGQWWRIFTCMFIHMGIIHILLNMGMLAAAGPLVERMVGNIGFLVLYLVAGLVGSLASLIWNPPLLVSVGASGAIFGVYGALLGLLLRAHGSIPAKALGRVPIGLGFLLFDQFFGMMLSNQVSVLHIDFAAHIGGLVAGFLCGIVLGQPVTPKAAAGRPVRNRVAGAVGAFLVIGGMIAVHTKHSEIANVQSELERFEAVEKEALDVYNRAVEKAQRQELSDAAFGDLLEREVLPEWREAQERLSALKQIPPPLQRHVASILEYMQLREEAWALLLQALREGSQQKAQQAAEKQARADAAAKRILDSAGK